MKIVKSIIIIFFLFTARINAQEDVVFLLDKSTSISEANGWEDAREFILDFIKLRLNSPFSGSMHLILFDREVKQDYIITGIQKEEDARQHIESHPPSQKGELWEPLIQAISAMEKIVKTPEALVFIINAQLPDDKKKPELFIQAWQNLIKNHPTAFNVWYYCFPSSPDEPTIENLKKIENQIQNSRKNRGNWNLVIGNPKKHTHIQCLVPQKRIFYSPEYLSTSFVLQFFPLNPYFEKKDYIIEIQTKLLAFPNLCFPCTYPFPSDTELRLPLSIYIPDGKMETYLDKPLEVRFNFKVQNKSGKETPSISYYPQKGEIRGEAIITKRPFFMIYSNSQVSFAMRKGEKKTFHLKLRWNKLAEGKKLSIQTLEIEQFLNIQVYENKNSISEIQLDNREEGSWDVTLGTNEKITSDRDIRGRLTLIPVGDWSLQEDIEISVKLKALPSSTPSNMPSGPEREVYIQCSSPFFQDAITPDLALLDGMPINPPSKFKGGRYHLWINHIGYNTWEGDVDIPSGQTPLFLTYPIVPKPRRVRLEVAFSELLEGDRLPEYKATLTSISTGKSWNLCEESVVPPGEYTLNIKSEGYQENVISFTIMPGRELYLIKRDVYKIYKATDFLTLFLWVGVPFLLLTTGFIWYILIPRFHTQYII